MSAVISVVLVASPISGILSATRVLINSLLMTCHQCQKQPAVPTLLWPLPSLAAPVDTSVQKAGPAAKIEESDITTEVGLPLVKLQCFFLSCQPSSCSVVGVLWLLLTDC